MNYSENKDLKTWEKLGVCLDDLKERDNILKNIEKIISYFQTEIKQQESLTFTKGWSSKITGE